MRLFPRGSRAALSRFDISKSQNLLEKNLTAASSDIISATDLCTNLIVRSAIDISTPKDVQSSTVCNRCPILSFVVLSRCAVSLCGPSLVYCSLPCGVLDARFFAFGFCLVLSFVVLPWCVVFAFLVLSWCPILLCGLFLCVLFFPLWFFLVLFSSLWFFLSMHFSPL